MIKLCPRNSDLMKTYEDTGLVEENQRINQRKFKSTTKINEKNGERNWDNIKRSVRKCWRRYKNKRNAFWWQSKLWKRSENWQLMNIKIQDNKTHEIIRINCVWDLKNLIKERNWKEYETWTKGILIITKLWNWRNRRKLKNKRSHCEEFKKSKGTMKELRIFKNNLEN